MAKRPNFEAFLKCDRAGWMRFIESATYGLEGYAIFRQGEHRQANVVADVLGFRKTPKGDRPPAKSIGILRNVDVPCNRRRVLLAPSNCRRARLCRQERPPQSCW